MKTGKLVIGLAVALTMAVLTGCVGNPATSAAQAKSAWDVACKQQLQRTAEFFGGNLSSTLRKRSDVNYRNLTYGTFDSGCPGFLMNGEQGSGTGEQGNEE